MPSFSIYISVPQHPTVYPESQCSFPLVWVTIYLTVAYSTHSIPPEPAAKPQKLYCLWCLSHGLFPCFMEDHFPATVPNARLSTSTCSHSSAVEDIAFLLPRVDREDGRKGLWVSRPLTYHTLFPLSPTTIVEQWLWKTKKWQWQFIFFWGGKRRVGGVLLHNNLVSPVLVTGLTDTCVEGFHVSIWWWILLRIFVSISKATFKAWFCS